MPSFGNLGQLFKIPSFSAQNRIVKGRLESLYLCYLGPHAEFHDPKTTASGRKVTVGKQERRTIPYLLSGYRKGPRPLFTTKYFLSLNYFPWHHSMNTPSMRIGQLKKRRHTHKHQPQQYILYRFMYRYTV
jgi:hypothetical protein